VVDEIRRVRLPGFCGHGHLDHGSSVDAWVLDRRGLVRTGGVHRRIGLDPSLDSLVREEILGARERRSATCEAEQYQCVERDREYLGHVSKVRMG
jgi:hypothetical protein